MASTTFELDLGMARAVAARLVELIDDSCERTLVVGSVLRGRPTVHDVELLVEPKFRVEGDGLFSDEVDVDLLERRYHELIAEGYLVHKLGGPRLKRFTYQQVPCELYIVRPPAQWGVLQLIRTGPAAFSKRLVTERRKGGYLPDGYRVHEGGIHYPEGPLIPTYTEEDVFHICGLPFIAIGNRE